MHNIEISVGNSLADRTQCYKRTDTAINLSVWITCNDGFGAIG
jgi:hypothetical protein